MVCVSPQASTAMEKQVEGILKAASMEEKGALQNVFSIMFPKFHSNSFLGRVCMLQVANYVGSLFLTMGSAMTDNAFQT